MFYRTAKSTATVWLALFHGRFLAKSLGRNDQATAIVRLLFLNFMDRDFLELESRQLFLMISKGSIRSI